MFYHVEHMLKIGVYMKNKTFYNIFYIHDIAVESWRL